jgi:hypothetical protein
MAEYAKIYEFFFKGDERFSDLSNWAARAGVHQTIQRTTWKKEDRFFHTMKESSSLSLATIFIRDTVLPCTI